MCSWTYFDILCNCVIIYTDVATVQHEIKERTGGFLSMLLCTSGASLLGNLLTERGIYRAWKSKGINRAVYGNEMGF